LDFLLKIFNYKIQQVLNIGFSHFLENMLFKLPALRFNGLDGFGSLNNSNKVLII
jgi:hypothetical protein